MSLKDDVLRALLDGQGPVSGEAIAERLGVSRAAVWLAVETLRREGHRVSAAPRRGYRIEGDDDVLDETVVRAFLTEGGPIRRVVCLEQVGSTNDYAKELALARADGASPDGTLILAARQTAGRGRRGRSFASPLGGVYMSLILRPCVGMERFQTITVAAALSVCLAIEELTPARPLVKWVNDVFVPAEDGRMLKVCGILSEAVTSVESGEIESVVVGIGIDLRAQSFDQELEGVAGSVLAPGDEDRVGRARLAANVAERLMGFAGRLDDPWIMQAYRERSMLLGQEISYVIDGRAMHVRAVGIDERGGLVIEDEHGTRTLSSGEVSLVRARQRGAADPCVGERRS